MQAQAEFRGSDAWSHAIADVAAAVSQRPGEGPEKCQTRASAATAMLEDCRPDDAVEVMLAGHCVMFHEVLIDGFRHTLLGEVDTTRRGTRANLVQMDRSFHACLDRLEERQAAKAEKTGEAVARQKPPIEATSPAAPTGQTNETPAATEAPEGPLSPPETNSTGTAALRHAHAASGVCEQRPPVLRAIDGKDGERPAPGATSTVTASGAQVAGPPVAAVASSR